MLTLNSLDISTEVFMLITFIVMGFTLLLIFVNAINTRKILDGVKKINSLELEVKSLKEIIESYRKQVVNKTITTDYDYNELLSKLTNIIKAIKSVDLPSSDYKNDIEDLSDQLNDLSDKLDDIKSILDGIDNIDFEELSKEVDRLFEELDGSGEMLEDIQDKVDNINTVVKIFEDLEQDEVNDVFDYLKEESEDN